MTMDQTKELSQQEIATIMESSEQGMWSTAWKNVPPEAQRELNMHLHTVGGASVNVIQGVPNPFFNRVLGLGIHQPATASMIDEIIAIYSQYDVPWAISLSPLAQPSDIVDWLTTRGFKRTTNLAKMIRGNTPPPTIETDLRVERVDTSTAAQFAEVNCRAFELPDWYAATLERMVEHDGIYGYIAYDGDEPAGSGLLMVSGEVGGLYSGATLPAYRRRGAQGAIMAQRIRDGIDLGCHWFSTETGEDTPEAPNPSYHNMVRTGFELAYLRPNYLYQPSG